jgi:hypothetical protein
MLGYCVNDYQTNGFTANGTSFVGYINTNVLFYTVSHLHKRRPDSVHRRQSSTFWFLKNGKLLDSLYQYRMFEKSLCTYRLTT